MKKYIFILCPPYQGSTILYKLVSSSPNVSSLIGNYNFNGEGQLLLRNKEYHQNRWDPNYEPDMDMIKECFDKYWNHSKNIYVEKSPPNICRAKMFEDYLSKFGEVYFIVSIRNPYSCRYNSDEWVKWAKYQKDNLTTLKNVIQVSYEEICENTQSVINKILNHIPELKTISIFGYMKGIPDHKQIINKMYIDRVSDKEKKNKVLINHQDIMKYFGYSFLE